MSAQHTPGPWTVATSNSWRRIVTAQRMTSVCEPVTQRDGHPDLHFPNGGEDGPDARLIAAAPDLLAALRQTTSLLHATCMVINNAEARKFALDAVRDAQAVMAKAEGVAP